MSGDIKAKNLPDMGGGGVSKKTPPSNLSCMEYRFKFCMYACVYIRVVVRQERSWGRRNSTRRVKRHRAEGGLPRGKEGAHGRRHREG